MLESHDLLHDHQFGFRRKWSTTSLLMTTVYDWAAGLNLSQTTHCLFLDMSKAFDSVSHERLLLKLQSYGVGGALLVWFTRFLTTRRQRVSLNDSFSSWHPVIQGCPRALFWALYFSSCMSMTSQIPLIVNLKFLLMILLFTTKSHLYRIVTFFNKILIPVYSGAHNGKWTWIQPNVKRCVFLTNNLHFLLHATVKISPFSGNKEWSIWAFTWISVWPGETTVSLSTPKPQGFLTFCGKSYGIWMLSICKTSEFLLTSLTYFTILMSGVDAIL